jgi:hypothetical protein
MSFAGIKHKQMAFDEMQHDFYEQLKAIPLPNTTYYILAQKLNFQQPCIVNCEQAEWLSDLKRTRVE